MSIEVKISKRKIPYKSAMNALHKRIQKIKSSNTNELIWILEHPLTYTAGIRSDKNEIIDKNVNVIKTNRGGKITLHNPGQKIIYFVLNLNKRKKDIRRLVNIIENSIIEFLSIYKIKSKKDKKNIGIWVNNKKIAAIGLRVSRWIAYHGCSINIKNNLDDYKRIIPCGLDNTKITSMTKETKINLFNIDRNLKKIFLKNINKI